MNFSNFAKLVAAVLGWIAINHLAHRALIPGYRDPIWWIPVILAAYSLLVLTVGDPVLRLTGLTLLCIALLPLLPWIMSFWISVPEPADWRHARQTRSLMESIRMGTELYEDHFGVPARWGEPSALLALLKGGNPERIEYIIPAQRHCGPGGILLDGWGEQLLFSTSATSRTILSMGMDHKLGTRDDLILSFPNYANQAMEGTAK